MNKRHMRCLRGILGTVKRPQVFLVEFQVLTGAIHGCSLGISVHVNERMKLKTEDGNGISD